MIAIYCLLLFVDGFLSTFLSGARYPVAFAFGLSFLFLPITAGFSVFPVWAVWTLVAEPLATPFALFPLTGFSLS
ncbi:MAG: hypothetical protein ACE5JX_07545 [Acidobacteriota bacterium]